MNSSAPMSSQPADQAPSSPPFAADLITTERLVVLRFLLEAGLHQVSEVTLPGRHSCVLLLQSACEMGLVIALDACGLEHKEVDRFDTLYSKVAESLKSTGWSTKNQWGLVRQLNRSRNSAHHHGITPDANQLAQHARAAERFLVSLVTELFAIDLRAVTRSAAISDEEVRAELAEAERAVVAGDATAAVHSSMGAFGHARRKWSIQRRDLGIREYSPRPSRDDLTSKEVRAALSAIGEIDEVQPFVFELGTYFWVKSIHAAARNPGSLFPAAAPISIDEAQRVLAFVFGWVVRWESFTSIYDVGRNTRWHASLRPPSSSQPQSGPRLSSAQSVETRWLNSLTASGMEKVEQFTIEIQVVDAPNDGFRGWLRDLNENLRSGWGNQTHQYVNADPLGRIRFSFTNPDEDLEAMVRVARDAISAASDSRAQRIEKYRDWHQQRSHVTAPYEAALLPITSHGLAIFRTVGVEPAGELSLDFVPEYHYIRATFSADGEWLNRSTAFESTLFKSSLQGATTRGGDSLLINPEVAADAARAAIVDAIEAAEGEKLEAERRRVADGQRLSGLQTSLAELLATEIHRADTRENS